MITMPSFTIKRSISLDAGHRIMTHGSKCRNMHGHRYKIEAVCAADHLHSEGEQSDMILDFGFLKEEMMQAIHDPCDHGFIAALADRELLSLFVPLDVQLDQWLDNLSQKINQEGAVETTHTRLETRLYVVPFQPTAEGLARHWFEALAPRVAERSGNLAQLIGLTVHETPNCVAHYSPVLI